MTKEPPRYPAVSPTLYAIARGVIRVLAALVTKRIVVQGRENIPAHGPYIMAINHLSYLDSPILLIVVPHIMYFLAGEKYQKHFFGPILRIGGAIFVQRGEADRAALRQAMAVLEDGKCLGMAVEGTRSKTGALIPGKTGTAYFATRANVPILPIALWGTEQIESSLKQLRRAEVHITIGELFRLPHGHARSADLDRYTDEIMTVIASMLPESYRGVYRDHPRLAQRMSSQAASE